MVILFNLIVLRVKMYELSPWGINLDYDNPFNLNPLQLHEITMVKHTEDWCRKQLFKYATKLANEHDVPVLVSVRDRKNVQITHGSKKVVEEFKADYDTDPKWKQKFDEDAADQRSTPDNEKNVNVDADMAYEQVQAARPPERLPFPLDLMSFDEKSEVCFKN